VHIVTLSFVVAACKINKSAHGGSCYSAEKFVVIIQFGTDMTRVMSHRSHWSHHSPCVVC